MFENVSKLQQYYYKLDLDGLLAPIIHLIIEIAGIKHQDDSDLTFSELVPNVFKVDVIYEENYPADLDEDELCSDIISYIEKDFISGLTPSKESDIKLLYKDHNLVIQNVIGGKNNKTLMGMLKSYAPVSKLFSLIDESVRHYESRLCTFVLDQNYSMSLRIVDSSPSDSLILPISWVDLSSLTKAPIDPESLYLSDDWKSACQYQDVLTTYAYYENDKLVALAHGEKLITIDDISPYVNKKENALFMWETISLQYSETKPCISVNSPLLANFREATKKVDFSRLLSHLKCNLFISSDGPSIKRQYSKFFENVYEIRQIKELERFHFYVSPNKECEHTLLGVYSLDKIGNDYNLLHWVNELPDGKHYTKNGNKDAFVNNKGKSVLALHPDCSYYFISKYFEDRFEDVVKSLGCRSLHNFSLRKKGQSESFIEIDSMVLSSSNEICFFEEKTRLTKFNIEETIQKIVKFHTYFQTNNPNIVFRYILVAPYCDGSVESTYKFFIDKKKGSTSARDGLAHKVYDFLIPIAQFDKLFLRCIVEPEYGKLKRKVKSIVK